MKERRDGECQKRDNSPPTMTTGTEATNAEIFQERLELQTLGTSSSGLLNLSE